jgi:hypothetical protein
LVPLLAAFAWAQVTSTGFTTTGMTVSPVTTGYSFYLSPAGSDSNNCTALGTPCLTLDHTRSLVRTALSTCAGPITIAVSGLASNPYYNTTSAFIASDTGTSLCPVTYLALPGQSPVFSGGTQITGWTRNVTTGTCAAAHTAGFTCDQVAIANTTPFFEALFYYNAGSVNYGARRFRPRLGANTYSATSVNNGASGGLTQYNGTFTGCYSPTQVSGGPAGVSSTSSVFIMGFSNAANNGLFQVNSCTSSTLIVNGATGVAETPGSAATVVNDIGTFEHAGNPSGTISNLALTSNVLTVTVSNTFLSSYNVTFTGITNTTWKFLDGTTTCTVSATGLSSSSFQCPYTHADITSTMISVGIATQGPNAINASFVYSTADNNLPTGLTSCNLGGPFDCEVFAWDKWTEDFQRISSTDDTHHTITTTCGPSNCRGSGGAGVPYQGGYRYMVENCLECFYQPGQWYLDRSSTNPNYPNWTLNYIELGGENPNTDAVVIPNNAQVLTATSIDYTTFQGLTFEHDNWTVPSTGYLSTQLDYNLPITASMVQCAACGSHVTFSGDTFQDTVTVGLAVTGASSPTITGNIFNDIGAYGARIGVAPNQSGTSPSDTQVPNNVTVSQNWFEETGRWFSSADGFMVGLANNVTVTNNDVGHTYHGASEVCEPGQPGPNQCSASPWVSTNHGDFNIVFKYNDFHDLVQGITVDTGVYFMTSYCPNSSVSTCQSTNQITNATGNVFSHNRVHDLNSAAVNGDTADIGVHCLYFDGNTGLWTVEYNLCYRTTGYLINQNFGPQLASQNNLFQNNILLNSAIFSNLGGGIRVQSPLNTILEFTAQSNIFGMDVLANVTANGQTGPPTGTSPSIQQFVKNLYYQSASGVWKFNFSNSANQNFATWQSNSEDTAGTISTNPGFTAPSNCANNSTIPVPGTCDDFTFTNGTGPGFGFVVGGTGMTYTFGPTVRITIPPVTDTYPIATLPLNQF